MKPFTKHIKDLCITIGALVLAFGTSLLFQYIFDVQEHITTVFVFAVFLISLLTDGYMYGIFASFIGTVAVNYAFTFPFFALNFTIPINGISGLVMIIISILTSALTTKLKHHEIDRIENEKERVRANLLRAVSHDLRTPLTTIYGSSTTLLENSSSMNAIQKENIIKGIKEDSEWLIRMVENLLSITKFDSGNVNIIKTPTVLDELIHSVVIKFKKRYSTQQINIQIPSEVIVIPMDPLLIEQVLINILENAVQHAIGMTNLTLNVSIENEQAIFEVQDNGCGIPLERLPSLFTGYNISNEETIDGHKKNAGIGLSVCATIIKAHGGEIQARNHETGGAIFRFTLNTEAINDDTE